MGISTTWKHAGKLYCLFPGLPEWVLIFNVSMYSVWKSATVTLLCYISASGSKRKIVFEKFYNSTLQNKLQMEYDNSSGLLCRSHTLRHLCIVYFSRHREAWGRRKLPCRSSASCCNSSGDCPYSSSKHGCADEGGWDRCSYESSLCMFVTEPSGCKCTNSCMYIVSHFNLYTTVHVSSSMLMREGTFFSLHFETRDTPRQCLSLI